MTTTTPSTSRTVDALGWYGMAAILGAYAGLSFDWLDEGPVYHLLNLTGALGVGLVCFKRRTWQPFWLEVIWGAVAAIALMRML